MKASTMDSMTTQLLTPIHDLQAICQTLLISQCSAHPSRPTVHPPSPEAFLAADTSLAEAVANARAHQRKQRRIEGLKSDILSLDAQWRMICEELEKGRIDLVQSIKEGQKRSQSIHEAKKGRLYCQYFTLLMYG